MRNRLAIARTPLALALVSELIACDSSSRAGAHSASLTREELLDPETCKGCHPQHYREWASSMHAYATDDPVFAAMNQRGQRESDGALGDFCVRCHAPLALREGATRDGLNLAELPKKLRGVTCYFCHNAVDVGAPFNNDIALANDTTLHGAIRDPVPNGAHRSAYSPMHDRNRTESSRLCGSCHDIVTPNGVHLERTYKEYQESLFSKVGPGFDTCSGCHMPGRPGAVALGASKDRVRHEHLWPGVDIALGDFPDREVQRRAVECELSLGTRIYDVVHDGLGGVNVRLETSAGHRQPSGSAIDRRMWLEVVAYDAAGAEVFVSGRIEQGQLELESAGSQDFDPQLAIFRDWIYDADGREVHMFWEAAGSADYPDGYASYTLPAPLTPFTPHTLQLSYQIPNFARVERIRFRLRLRPVGVDVLRDLVGSGDLNPEVIDAMPTWTLHGAAVDYSPKTGRSTPLWPEQLQCPDSYRCLLEPGGC